MPCFDEVTFPKREASQMTGAIHRFWLLAVCVPTTASRHQTELKALMNQGKSLTRPCLPINNTLLIPNDLLSTNCRYHICNANKQRQGHRQLYVLSVCTPVGQAHFSVRVPTLLDRKKVLSVIVRSQNL